MNASRCERKKYPFAAIAGDLLHIIVALFILFFFHPASLSIEPAEQVCNGIVKRVIDGDTVILLMNGREEKARLIGVDTPEKNHPFKAIQYYSREASEFLEKLCEGKKVAIEYDHQRMDKYGRLLVYLFLEDGKLINAEIIKGGYGFAYTRFPFGRMEEFKKYEQESREHERGLWKNGGMDEIGWFLAIGRKPYKLYDMAGGKWGIECEGFVKLRLSEKDLSVELANLRLWSSEVTGEELQRTLSANGWRKFEE